MILTCPDCATRYSVKDDAVGPNGRMVRCSQCKTSWFVASDPDTLELMDNQASDMAVIDEPVPATSQPRQASSGIKPTMGAHVQIRDMADQKRRNRRLMGVSMIWLVTFGLLGSALMTAFVFRQSIVDRTPAAASLYQAFGIKVKQSGLDFESPKTKNAIVNGQPVLIVNGFVRNLTRETKELPLIELSLMNHAGEVLATWLVELDQSSLSPNDRLEYISRYPNPPLDAVTLEYRFVDHSGPGKAIPLTVDNPN